MSEAPHRPLREQELAFFGRIAADVSHDMRNVLAIVGQYAGLMGDLLAVAERGKPPDYAKLKKTCANITRQVGKGTQTMERFSRFAHAADEQTTSFDLGELVGNLAALAQRQVALARCTLEVDLPKKAVPVRANPFSLQHAVFSALGLVLELLDAGETLTIKLVRQKSTAVLCISGNAAADRQAALSGRVAQLVAAVDELQGSVATSDTDGILSLTVTVPVQ